MSTSFPVDALLHMQLKRVIFFRSVSTSHGCMAFFLIKLGWLLPTHFSRGNIGSIILAPFDHYLIEILTYPAHIVTYFNYPQAPVGRSRCITHVIIWQHCRCKKWRHLLLNQKKTKKKIHLPLPNKKSEFVQAYIIKKSLFGYIYIDDHDGHDHVGHKLHKSLDSSS